MAPRVGADRASALKSLTFCLFLFGWVTIPLGAQDLTAEDVRIGLDSAVHLAHRVAATEVPDLSSYLLYSVIPRALKGDPGGLHWQVLWKARAFPHRRVVAVRVYMKDGHAAVETPEASASFNE
jgi:hypothetical protein